jgi:hypothetical protein
MERKVEGSSCASDAADTCAFDVRQPVGMQMIGSAISLADRVDAMSNREEEEPRW